MYDSGLSLRALSSGAITTTTAGAALALEASKFGTFKAVVNVTAIDTTSGNETYVLSIEADTASGFSSPVAVAMLPGISATGKYEIPLSGTLISQHKAGATHLRIKATLGGTTPSLTYGAQLEPIA